eukprot:Gb_30612 [translate_table: standard]
MLDHLCGPESLEHYKKNGSLGCNLKNGNSALYNHQERVSKKNNRRVGKWNATSSDSNTVAVVHKEMEQDFTLAENVADDNVVSRSGSILACESLIPGMVPDIKLTENSINDDEVCNAFKPSSAILMRIDNGAESLQAKICIQNSDVENRMCTSVSNLVFLGQNVASNLQVEQFVNSQFGNSNSMDAKVTLIGTQGGSASEKCQGSVSSTCVGVGNKDSKPSSQVISIGTNSMKRNSSIVSSNGSFGGIDGGGSVGVSGNDGGVAADMGNNGFNCEVDKAKKDIKVVVDEERVEHSPQVVGRESEADSDHRRSSSFVLEHPVVGGKGTSGNTSGLGSSSVGSFHGLHRGSGYKRFGKENNRFVWQKVRKDAAGDCAAESKASDHLQLHSGSVLKNGPVAVKSATTGVTTSMQTLPTITEQHSNCRFIDKEHSSELEKHKEHGRYKGQNNGKATSNISMQGEAARSQAMGDETAIQPLPLQSKERQNVGNIFVHATETGKGVWARKKGSTQSGEHSTSSHKRGVDSSLQPIHYKNLNNGSRNIQLTTQHKAHLSLAQETEQLRSSSGYPAQHGYGETLQFSRDNFDSGKSCSQDSFNRRLSTSSASASVDQMILQTKQVSSHMTSARQITEVQHIIDEGCFCPTLLKGRKITEYKKGVSRERNVERDRHSQQVSQKWVPVESKMAGVVRLSSVMGEGPDNQGSILVARDPQDGRQKQNESCSHKSTSSADIHITHFTNKTAFPKQEIGNIQSHASAEIQESADTEQQEMETTKIDHKRATAEEAEHISEASYKTVCEVTNPVSCNGGLKKMAERVLKAISASCQYQMASENISCSIGSPLAEFEKVLHGASPVVVPAADKQQCQNSSRNELTDNFICRCQIANIPLKSIWKWYEEPGNYGLEVKAWDIQQSKSLGYNANQFRAYYVPYLSGMKLFGFSTMQSGCNSTQKGSIACSAAQNGNLPIHATCLLKSSGANESDRSGCLGSSIISDSSSSCGSSACNMSEDLNFGDLELLFEFFESEQPQRRRPMFEKIRELTRSDAGSNFQLFGGDSHSLDSTKLGDLHPASWFAVAWYPVYRIPEGHLRAAFLTYHSLGHFLQRRTLSNALDRGIDCSIVAPVVGLQSYNSQAECWFVLRKEFEDYPVEKLPSNPSKILQERLKSLEETAASMARGSTEKCCALHTKKHSDYEFFLGR